MADKVTAIQKRRPRGMLAIMAVMVDAIRAQNSAYQRHTKKLPGWSFDQQRHGAHLDRHPGAFGGRLVRFAFPAGYTGCLLTPQEKRRRALREACAAAGMAVRGINA